MKGFRRFGGFIEGPLVACLAAFAVALLVGLAGPANAQFDELIPAKIEIIKFAGSPAAGRLYKLVSKPLTAAPPFTLPSADPATTGGSLSVGVAPGRLDCTLAAQAYDGTEGWLTLGSPPKGYKYINKLAPGGGVAGACKLIMVKTNVIKVLAKATGGLPVPLGTGLNPDIDTVLTLGGDDYCAKADVPPNHFKEVAGKLIKAKNQPAPAACPVIPTTTTTTTLPTTTTTGGASTTTTSGTVPSTSSTSGTVPSTTSTSGTVPSTTTTTWTLPPPPVDHFTVYNIIAGGPAPWPPAAILEDQFHVEDAMLGPVKYFLPPAIKNGEQDPSFNFNNRHLTCYDITMGSWAANALVRNQFGDQSLKLGNPDSLCVPTDKLIGQPVQVPRDHYKCYEASGLAPMVPQVTLVDQFIDPQGLPVNAEVLEPFLFCNPVLKSWDGLPPGQMVNPLVHLTCYHLGILGIPPPPVGPVVISNQFYQEQISVGSLHDLCVPSLKLEWAQLGCAATEPPMCNGWCPPLESCTDLGGVCACSPL